MSEGGWCERDCDGPAALRAARAEADRLADLIEDINDSAGRYRAERDEAVAEVERLRDDLAARDILISELDEDRLAMARVEALCSLHEREGVAVVLPVGVVRAALQGEQ